MAAHQSPLAVIVKGALAGAAGTAVMGAFRARAPELLGSIGLAPAEPRIPPEEPDAPSSPTRELAERVGEGTSARGDRASAAEAMHWAYGAGWGAYFAVIQSTFRPWPPMHGLFLGGLMTFVATRVIPEVGLVPPPRTRDEVAVSAAAHAVFGVVTALAYQVLNLGRRG